MAFIIKGEKVGRPGRWIVVYDHAPGKRTWKTFQSKEEAKEYLENNVPLVRGLRGFTITFGDYAKRRWLPQVRASLKRRTFESYKETLDVHLVPAFGKMRVRDLDRGSIKAFLVSKLSQLSRGSVRIVHAVLRAALNAAVDDGLVHANPAARLGRQLRLVASP